MGVTIGIDIGGSATKIVGFDARGRLLEPMTVKASDPITATYGALGKFTLENNLKLDDISKVVKTGAGSEAFSEPIYGLDCERVSEFPCIGRGGLYLCGLDEAIVVSMGTGTAFIHAKRGGEMTHLGGTGVGGGSLRGLSHKIIDADNVPNIIELASSGNLANVDLRISDISRGNGVGNMADDVTAANFGNLSDLATREDLALGLVNMILETIGMLAVFAAKANNIRDIVLTGNMSNIPQNARVIDMLTKLHDVNFITPKNSEYATAAGAALGVVDRTI